MVIKGRMFRALRHSDRCSPSMPGWNRSSERGWSEPERMPIAAGRADIDHEPSGGTYHPKVYLARRGDEATAIIGSANLTGGLVNNVEAAIVLRGHRDDRPIADAWSWAEDLWSDPRTGPWVGTEAVP